MTQWTHTPGDTWIIMDPANAGPAINISNLTHVSTVVPVGGTERTVLRLVYMHAPAAVEVACADEATCADARRTVLLQLGFTFPGKVQG